MKSDALIVRVLVLLGFGSSALMMGGCGAGRAQKSRAPDTDPAVDSVIVRDRGIPVRVLYGVPPARFDPDKPIQERTETITVSGRVTDWKGEPILGVVVSVLDTPGLGALADENGLYSIKVKMGDKLCFASIGVKTQTIEVTGSTLDVQMERDENNVLEQVVIKTRNIPVVSEADLKHITAYGVQPANYDPNRPVPEAEIITVSGCITDEKGKALEGVIVNVSGNPSLGWSDSEGRYSIKVAVGDTLYFHQNGYDTKIVKVKNTKRLDVKLKHQ